MYQKPLFDEIHPLLYYKRQKEDCFLVFLKVTPKASRERIGGIKVDASGQNRLCVYVVKPPQDNEANEAVIALLSQEWRLAKNNISLVQGANSRLKTVLVERIDESLLLNFLII